MINVSDIRNFFSEFCPESLAFDRDNVGLIVGRADKDVDKVLLTLDVDENVVNEAIMLDADIIVSHHPLMFNAVRRLTDSTPAEKTLRALVANDIALVSAHTNLDCINGGLNDYLASKLGVRDTHVIEVEDEFGGKQHGYGRVGFTDDGMTLGDMLSRITNVLPASGLRYVGDTSQPVKRVALNCGGGASEMDICISMGVDLFITGDVKYNPARDAYENGMAVIDAGHYETEFIVTELFARLLGQRFPSLELVCSEANIPVFKYYTK